MELEMIKSSWDKLNRKLESTATLNEKLINNIFSSRVSTRVELIKRSYILFYVILTIEAMAFTAILAGNPFDFIYTLQYVPYALLLGGVIFAFANLVHLHRSIDRMSAGTRIDEYLRHLVMLYEKNNVFERWFGLSLFAVALTIPFSFLPPKIAKVGVAMALLDTLIPVLISLAMFVVAHKLGLFRNRNKEQFQRELKAWHELKALVEDV